MREILFLAHRLPWPPDRGDKIRSWHLLKRLAQIAPVHVACFADDAEELAHADALDSFAARRCVVQRTRTRLCGVASGVLTGRPFSLSLFDSAQIRAFVAHTLATRDIGCIFGFSAQMAPFVPQDRGDVRFVMDFVDVDSQKFKSYAQSAGPVMRRVYAREARLLARFEQETAARADVNLFVSEAEAALFRRLSGNDYVSALPNGVDAAFFDPAGAYDRPAFDGPLIVLTGQMDYRPNVDAVTRFARETLPLIRAAQPKARIAIVGRKPVAAVTALAALPGVIVTGEVADVRGWLAAADVVVAPLGIARGIQNKVLEAMAMARPVVASTAAFEGIEAAAGRDLLVADGAVAEAKAVLGLMADPDRASSMGRAARAQVRVAYDWDARLSGLPAIVGIG
ncbi:sugar transferase (PEP-CTERM/EpsH1 system associated) [Sphingobium boeckii]|uniref:Sugar transferase (PEP-CTERM/EpsH1 system associated) n=2 Tax=Sphingobium boeckii TaxID=1082345 RepID=A0A7W9AKY3_9SPHN|nr:sugar transferase (PEP-CTERM/EpsH1 system associated) [Sphingobium boeckii]